MSITISDLVCINDTINENEINEKIYDDQKATSDHNKLLNEELLTLNDISNKNLSNDVLQETKIKDEKEKVTTLDVPVDVITNNEYDSFAGDNIIYKKYQLRQRKKTVFNQEYEDNIAPKLHHKTPKTITKLKENHECPYCFLYFTSKNRCMLHIASHEKKASFLCSQCSMVFISNVELITHKDLHEKKVHFCKLCKLAFTEYSDFLIHKTTHRIKKQYKCPECDYICERKYFIQIHIQTHFNTKVKCDICNKMITSRNFQKHLKEHSFKFECGECGKVCKTKSTYKYHMSVHAGVKLFQCLYCGKGFYNNQQRFNHTQIHTGEKRYECPVCFEKYRQVTDMKKHLVTHDTVKRHKCTICNKRFFHKDYLDNIHMKRHLNKPEYKCDFCMNAYFNKAGLKAHVLYVHTNEKPFKCKSCNMSFVNKGKYNRHCRTQSHNKR